MTADNETSPVVRLCCCCCLSFAQLMNIFVAIICKNMVHKTARYTPKLPYNWINYRIHLPRRIGTHSGRKKNSVLLPANHTLKCNNKNNRHSWGMPVFWNAIHYDLMFSYLLILCSLVYNICTLYMDFFFDVCCKWSQSNDARWTTIQSATGKTPEKNKKKTTWKSIY